MSLLTILSSYAIPGFVRTLLFRAGGVLFQSPDRAAYFSDLIAPLLALILVFGFFVLVATRRRSSTQTQAKRKRRRI